MGVKLIFIILFHFLESPLPPRRPIQTPSRAPENDLSNPEQSQARPIWRPRFDKEDESTDYDSESDSNFDEIQNLSPKNSNKEGPSSSSDELDHTFNGENDHEDLSFLGVTDQNTDQLPLEPDIVPPSTTPDSQSSTFSITKKGSTSRVTSFTERNNDSPSQTTTTIFKTTTPTTTATIKITTATPGSSSTSTATTTTTSTSTTTTTTTTTTTSTTTTSTTTTSTTTTTTTTTTSTTTTTTTSTATTTSTTTTSTTSTTEIITTTTELTTVAIFEPPVDSRSQFLRDIFRSLYNNRGDPRSLIEYSNEVLEQDFQDAIEECCTYGKHWAANQNRCEAMPGKYSRSLGTELCSATSDICCESTHSVLQCYFGYFDFTDEKTCAYETELETERSQCCNCCQLGQKARKNGHICQADIFLPEPCKSSYLSCCENGTDSFSPSKGFKIDRLENKCFDNV